MADLSGHIGKVEVGIRNLIIVDMRTEVFVRGVRGAEFNGMSVGQHAVATLSRGCSGKDVDLKFFALRVFFSAFRAISAGTLLGTPAGVKPLSPMVSPFG